MNNKLSYFIVDGVESEISDEQARQNIGDIGTLKTTEKTNIVSAINEVNSKKCVTIEYNSTNKRRTINT